MRIVWGTASIFVLATVVLAARAAAQGSGFDGTLTYVMHSETGKTAMLVTATKGQKIRVDVSDPANPTRQAAFLIDGVAHTRTILLPTQKKYFTVPASMAAAMGGMGSAVGGMGGSGAAAAGTPPKFTFTKTGRTETVAGVSCQVIHGTSTASDGQAVEGDVCVAKGVGFNPGSWALLGGGQAPGHTNMDAIRDAIGPGNGVLKMTSSKGGKQEFDLEVTKIDRSSPSDAEFSPPADYTAFSLGGWGERRVRNTSTGSGGSGRIG
jgi:hypothetical protein